MVIYAVLYVSNNSYNCLPSLRNMCTKFKYIPKLYILAFKYQKKLAYLIVKKIKWYSSSAIRSKCWIALMFWHNVPLAFWFFLLFHSDGGHSENSGELTTRINSTVKCQHVWGLWTFKSFYFRSLLNADSLIIHLSKLPPLLLY